MKKHTFFLNVENSCLDQAYFVQGLIEARKALNASHDVALRASNF